MIGPYDAGLVQLTYVLPNPGACHESAQTGVATQKNSIGFAKFNKLAKLSENYIANGLQKSFGEIVTLHAHFT